VVQDGVWSRRAQTSAPATKWDAAKARRVYSFDESEQPTSGSHSQDLLEETGQRRVGAITRQVAAILNAEPPAPDGSGADGSFNDVRSG